MNIFLRFYPMQNKVVITGASSGIGESLVQYFYERDWSVVMIARDSKKLKAISDQFKGTTWISCDLSMASEIKILKNQLLSDDHPTCALVNNAGLYRPVSITDETDEHWDIHFQNNLMSAVRITRLLWNELKLTQGSIVNISSTLALRPIAGTAAYSALKSAMNNWTLSLALEGAPFQVKANAIAPGIIDTPIHSYFGSDAPKDLKLYNQLQKAQPLGRTGKPNDISAMTYQLCQKESQWITGTIINIDGGILLNS